MAGTLLGSDQIRKLNSMFPLLVAHLKELLAADHTGYGLMKVHMMVESFDSDEMSRIFRELSFISPKEKLALIRAAVYEAMASAPELFVTPKVDLVFVPKDATKPAEVVQTFNPPQFKLNVNRSTDFHGQAPADTPAPAPVVTSTHTPKINAALEAGKVEQTAQTEKLNAAVAKLRAVNTPIEIPVVPEDATLPQVEE